MDALDLLRADHDEVRSLFDRFRAAHETGDTASVQSLAAEALAALVIHTAIEEEIFYPAVREAGGEDMHELVDESNEEHHVVDLLMAEIRGLDPGDSAFAAKMAVLIENVEHHASEEENEMFPKVRTLIDDQKREALGKALADSREWHRLRRMSKDELYDKAAKLDIDGRSTMSKDELAHAVADLLTDSSRSA